MLFKIKQRNRKADKNFSKVEKMENTCTLFSCNQTVISIVHYLYDISCKSVKCYLQYILQNFHFNDY